MSPLASSQRCDSYRWFDPMEHFPCDLPRYTATAQHALPAALHGPIYPMQRPEVPGNSIVSIVATKHLVEVDIPKSDTVIYASEAFLN